MATSTKGVRVWTKKEKFDKVDFSPTAKVPFRDKIGWAVCGPATGMPWVVFGYYLMFFYTDVLQISPVLAGSIMVFARVFDAFTDIAIGWAIDRFNPKWGKYRSWPIISFAISFGLYVLTFAAIPGAPVWWKMIVAWVGYGCYGAIGSTLQFIPFNCMLTNITTNPEERASMTGIKGTVSNIGTLLVVSTYMPIVNFFGGKERGFFIAAVIFGLFYLCCAFSACKTSEKYELNADGTYRPHLRKVAEKSKTPLITQLKYLVTNRPAVISLIGIFIFYGLQQMRSSMIVYMYNYYFELPELSTISLFLNAGMAIVGALMIAPLIKIFKDSNRAYVITIMLSALSFLAFYFVCMGMGREAATESMRYGPLFFLFVISGLFYGAYSMFIYAILPSCVDYGVWKNGYNQAGIIYAVLGFALTFGAAIGGQVMGIMLNGIGYVADTVLTESTRNGLVMIGMLVPGVLAVVHGVLQCFYGMSDKKHAQYVKEIESREAQA